MTFFLGKGANSSVLHWDKNDQRNRWKSNFQTPQSIFDTSIPGVSENPKASPNGDPKIVDQLEGKQGGFRRSRSSKVNIYLVGGYLVSTFNPFQKNMSQNGNPSSPNIGVSIFNFSLQPPPSYTFKCKTPVVSFVWGISS